VSRLEDFRQQIIERLAFRELFPKLLAELAKLLIGEFLHRGLELIDFADERLDLLERFFVGVAQYFREESSHAE
jgi:hypothetical protein